MNQIEAAKLIISQDGDCDGVLCDNCPAEKTRQKLDLESCDDLWGYSELEENLPKIIEWFENWLSENKKQENVMERIKFESEEQAYKFCEENNFGMNHEAILWHVNRLKQNGYIRKSPLQQKVERVEASLKDYIDGNSVDIIDTFKASIDVIQLLKQSHPEFKEK